MPSAPKSKVQRNVKRTDPKVLANFVEELSWLLNSYSDLDFKSLAQLVQERTANPARLPSNTAKGRLPTNPNIKILVGLLPGLFVDERLFPSNEDIAEFAASALGVQIPRWQKKSKFELIGHVVCTANGLRDSALASLVSALTEVTGEGNARATVERQRQSGVSWNEVIQSLLKDRDG